MKVEGHCQCRAIRFEAEINPEAVTVCHCTDCQEFAGGPYRVSVPAKREAFRLLAGQPKVYIKVAESGNRRAQGFCSDCGSAIYAADEHNPQVYMLRVGTMAQRAELAPKRQIWTRSAMPWLGAVEKLPRAEKQT